MFIKRNDIIKIITLTILSIILITTITIGKTTTHNINKYNSKIINTYKENPWPMFRHDLKHTGYTKYTGPPTPTLAWNYTAKDGIVSSAAISYDGTIYIGIGWNTSKTDDPHLYALNPNGTLKWKYQADDGFFSSPAITSDRMIYITCLDGRLYAIEDNITNGKLKWKTHLGYSFNLCSPALSKDGIIHVGSPGFKYYQIYPNGTIKWSYKTDWCIISSPAIDENDTIYIGSKDHYLYAFKPDKLKWKFPTGKFYDGHLVDSSPAIGRDGTIYFGTDQYGAWGQTPIEVHTNFWAVNPNGTLKWLFETEDGVESSPAIGPDRTLYFGSYDGNLYAVYDNEKEGILKWKFKTNGPIDGSPIIDGDGIIYFASRDSNIYALYPNGTLKWKFTAEEGFESSPSIDDKGYLYIGSFDGNIYCIGTGNSDVGVSRIHISSHVKPGSIITPSATIRNYRKNSEIFNVSCKIFKEDEIIYSDIIQVDIPGGSSKQYNFSNWSINPIAEVEYKIIIKTHHRDENPENNELSSITLSNPNNHPNTPVINGPTNGRANKEYTYTFYTTDKENDDIYYNIDWGDGDNIKTKTYPSNKTISIKHKYNERGTYNIRAKAIDTFDDESEWGTLTITMLKTKTKLSYLKILLEKYPYLSNILEKKLIFNCK